MKTLVCLAVTCISTIVTAQYYDYTGKVSGLNIASSPLSSLHAKTAPVKINTYITSLEYTQMVIPGVFPTIGYTYQRAYTSNTNQDQRVLNSLPFSDGHQLNTSIEFRKCILNKTYKVKSVMGCFFKRVGILFAPEYNYLYSSQIKNTSSGEFALKAGLYFYQGSTKINVSKNILYSLYYRKGFSPLVTTETSSLYRDEIGIRVTVLFRELYRFGW